jgi:hypothetical protein
MGGIVMIMGATAMTMGGTGTDLVRPPIGFR